MKFRIFLLLAELLAFSGRAQADGVTNLWEFRLPGQATECSPALAPNGTIYIGTFSGWLVALTSDGKMKWKFKAGLEIKSSPAVADDGTVYFGSRDRNFYALSPDGKLEWKFATGAWVDSSPAIARDGTVCFGSWDNTFYALNPDGSLKWKYATSNIIDSSPAIAADGTIYFGSHDQNLYALTPDGKLKWKFATGAQITSSPAIAADGTIYFSSTDGNFYALTPDGAERWHLHTSSYTSSSPALDEDGHIYLGTSKEQCSISQDGKLRWRSGSPVPMNPSPVVAANGREYFSLPWLRVGAFDHSGKLQWEYHVKEGNLQSSPNLGPNGVIYVSDHIYLYALAPLADARPAVKNSWPMWRANPQHTGRVQP